METSSPEPKQRLLQSAIREFALHGYEQGTVRRICSRAEVNLNAVKYYFTDKRGLYVEAVKEAHRLRQRTLPPIPDPSPLADPPGRTPQERLRAFIGHLVTISLSREDRTDYHHLLIFREMTNPSEATPQVVQEFIRPHFARLDQILEQLLPDETPEFDRHLLGFSIVGQCMYYKIASPVVLGLLSAEEQESLTVENVAEHIFQVTWAAIARRHERAAT